MDGESLTWALLAPAPRARLDALAREYWREEVIDDEEDYEEEGWEVVGGAGDYSAVLDRNPGSEDTHEHPLAVRLSRALGRPVYVLYLTERFAEGDSSVAVYEGGRQTDQRGLPYDLAHSLGVTLPGDEDDEPDAAGGGAGRLLRGAVVAEGVRADEAARALELDEPPRGPLHIVDGPAGAVIYDEESDSAPPVTTLLSLAYPSKHVYTLITDPEEGRFTVRVTLDGETLGTFESPASSARGADPALDSVKGETEPRRIAAALGLPPGLLEVP